MTFTFPMWHEGRKRLLLDALAGIPDETAWRLKWFDGSIQSGYTCPEIDTPIDVALSSAELNRLARALTDLNEMVLFGRYDGFDFRLECEDSTRWVVICPPDRAVTVAGWLVTLSPSTSAK